MKNLFFIPLLFISFALWGATYYVSPTGNDAGTGTIGDPWKTWGFAFNNTTDIGPGDTVYFRGGVYYKTLDEPSSYYYAGGAAGGWGYKITVFGSVGDTVRFWAYPGETPILDCGNVNDIYGIRATDPANVVDYCHFKGLTIRNVNQWVEGTTTRGWWMYAKNTIVEQCVIYNADGGGFTGGAGGGGPLYYINCDVYDICDSLGMAGGYNPGGQGSGFNNSSDDGYTYYIGCRAWRCSDQGFSIGAEDYTEFSNCWSFNNGILGGLGHGWKLGWVTEQLYYVIRKMTNCIAAFNKYSGVVTNDNNYPDVAYMEIFNNTVYKNGYGFMVSNTTAHDTCEIQRTFRNNISYANTNQNFFLGTNALYTHSNNTWDSDVTVTAADFVYELDSATIMNALLAERQSDGSLPEFNYFDLASASDLIDAGTDVGLPYNGEAPDIGAFEYEAQEEATTPTVITGQVWNISTTGCVVIGNNNDDGGGTVSAKGVCYAETENPDLEDDYTDEGGGTGIFNSTISGLSENTTYHVRAYATNEVGTAYGDDVEFTTAEEVTIYVGNKPVYHNGLLIKH